MRTKRLVDAMPFSFEHVKIYTEPFMIIIRADMEQTITYSRIAKLVYNCLWEMFLFAFKRIDEKTIETELNELGEILRNKNIRIKTMDVSCKFFNQNFNFILLDQKKMNEFTNLGLELSIPSRNHGIALNSFYSVRLNSITLEKHIYYNYK